MEKREKYQGRPLLFSLLLTAVLLLLTSAHLVRRWDCTLYDLASPLFHRPAPPDIVILAIDEHSLARLGRWPWPRRIHARVVDKLSLCATKGVGLDILFVEPSPDGSDDQLLARAIRRNGHVILPVVNETAKAGGPIKLTRPLPEIAGAAAGLGHVDVELDPDGIVRRTFLKAGPGRADLPAFALAMLLPHAQEMAGNLPGLRNPDPARTTPGTWVRDYQVLIPFAGPPGHFRRISLADFLDPSFDTSVLKDAYVLVGVTAPGLGDSLATPVSGNGVPMPGVELNANILDTIRTGQAILPMTMPMQLALGCALVLLSFLLYPRLQPRSSLAAVILLLALTLLATGLLLRWQHLWFPPVATLVCLVLGYLLWTWRRLEWTVTALAREKEQALVTLQSIGDGVIRIDREGRVRYLNPMAEQLTACSCGEAHGRPLAELVQLSDERHGRDLGPLFDRCRQADRPATVQVDARLANRDGREYIVHVSAGTIRARRQGTSGVVLGISDLTETRSMAERLAFQTTHDPLTGLPNRVLLKDRLGQAISRAGHRRQRVAVYHVDLDSFKKANDLLGHAGADQLLQEAATRLQDAAGPEMTVSRLAGDEFVILQEELSGRDRVEEMAKELLASLRRPFVIEGQTIRLSASIGISLFPDHGTGIDELLRNADIAMSHVKETSGNDVQVFTGRMQDWLQERLELEKNLRLALENDELELYYQPQIRLSDGRLMGVEALLRWQTRDGRHISPARFIPIAEESDLILAIGRWVLEKACRQAKEWQDAGYPPITMAVNISPRQFLQKDYLDLIVGILEKTGMPARYLELEITENTIIRHLEHSSRFIQGFRELGGTVSIDDFGTGYSSLSYLKQFPVDHLKIDRFFVRDIAVAPEDAAITRAVIAMAHGLDLSVVAEGVETQEQLAKLLDQECDKVQGYLLAKPMTAREMTVLLARGGSCAAYPTRDEEQ
ncbi:MAG TPA: EAL domain-containing protein [Desulfobulbus sp.]|nr:EAL domain-containing protein [Desulfobulbus sp.]